MRLFGQGELLGEAALQPQCRDLRREFDDQHRIGETTQRLRAVIAAGDDQERYASGESEQKAEKIGSAALRERRDSFIARCRLAPCPSPQLAPVPTSTPSGPERFPGAP